MKQLLITILLLTSLFKVNAQTYLGLQLDTEQIPSVTIESTIDTSFILMSLKTTINSVDPTFKGMLGFKLGNNKIHSVIFLPIFNLSLKEFKYNTPFVVQVRYRPGLQMLPKALVTATAELYKSKPLVYLNISIPFE